MSAWIVGKVHVDLLVQACIVEGLGTFAEADEMGQDLWQGNWAGFDYNYGGRYPDERPDIESYRFSGVEAPLDPVVVIKQAESWWYQSCDLAGFEETPPAVLVALLLDRLCGRLGVSLADTGHLPGYGRAPWGSIESLDEAVAKMSA